jgi:putative inorganic carbon (hco3(-)) transporter
LPDLKFFTKKENIIVLVLSLLFILVNAKLVTMGIPWLNLLPMVFLIVIMALFSLDNLMFLLVFFVPLSIPLNRLVEGLPVNLSLPTEPIIFGIMIMFFIKLIYTNNFDKRIVFHPVSVAILFSLAWILITSCTSEMPLVSFKFFLSRLWFIVVFYFLATQLFQKYGNMIKYNWMYASGLIIIIFYSVSRLAVHGLTNHQAANNVVVPFYNDHTDYASAIVMILVFVVGFMVIKRKDSINKRLIYIGFSIFFFVALILSYTRASWLSLVIALGFLVALLMKFRLRYIFMILSILIGLFMFFRTDIIIALERNTQDSNKNLGKHIISMTNISTDASNMERLNRWKCALRMFNDRPIFGFGPGTYQFQYGAYQKKNEKTIISTTRGNVGNAHSEFLGPLAEQGIFGTLSYTLILITTMATAGKLYFRSKRRKVRLLALTLLIGLLSYYAHGFMNNFLDSDKLSVLFWGFTAMIVALDVYHAHDLKKLEA